MRWQPVATSGAKGKIIGPFFAVDSILVGHLQNKREKGVPLNDWVFL